MRAAPQQPPQLPTKPKFTMCKNININMSAQLSGEACNIGWCLNATFCNGHFAVLITAAAVHKQAQEARPEQIVGMCCNMKLSSAKTLAARVPNSLFDLRLHKTTILIYSNYNRSRTSTVTMLFPRITYSNGRVDSWVTSTFVFKRNQSKWLTTMPISVWLFSSTVLSRTMFMN